MSTVALSRNYSSVANVFGGTLTAHLPQSFSEISLQINLPSFNCSLVLPLIDIDSEIEVGKVILRAAVDFETTISLILIGELFEEDDNFQIRQVDWNIETTTEIARSDFVGTSLRAMLALSERVNLQIPELRLDLEVEFNNPLLDIGQMLRRRQIAYRVMVIEKATSYKFQLPLDITGEQVSEITLIYRAIVERAFDWPIDSLTVFFPASEEWRRPLDVSNQLRAFKLGPDPITRSLFGKQIELGAGIVTVLDKHFENFDKVRQELAQNNGQQVQLVIRSLSGHGRYDLPEAPRLPSKPWDEKLQKLIDLEERLDAALVARYHTLAGSTLEGLTEEGKAAITTRPELGVNAFLH